MKQEPAHLIIPPQETGTLQSIFWCSYPSLFPCSNQTYLNIESACVPDMTSNMRYAFAVLWELLVLKLIKKPDASYLAPSDRNFS